MDDRRDSSAARWIRGALTERLAYKGAALFFAVVLWLVVSAEEPSEQVVAVRVELEHDSARTLTSEPPMVRALVVGRARELLKLFNEPLVARRPIPHDAPDTVRVALRPQDVHVPAGLDVVVRDLQPEVVTAVFMVRMSRQVPVRSRLELVMDRGARGVAAPRLVPESVTVTGPRRDVEEVVDVPTMPATIVVHDSTSERIPLDLASLGRVRVRPTEVRLTLAGRSRNGARAPRADSPRADSSRADSPRADRPQ